METTLLVVCEVIPGDSSHLFAQDGFSGNPGIPECTLSPPTVNQSHAPLELASIRGCIETQAGVSAMYAIVEIVDVILLIRIRVAGPAAQQHCII